MASRPAIDVGGQAVIEGVMMRSPKSFAVVCRRPSGEIEGLLEGKAERLR